MSHPTEQLTSYLTGELDATESAHVAAHLATCPACRSELEELEASIFALIGTLPDDRPPERVWAGIEARTDETARRRLEADARTVATPAPGRPSTGNRRGASRGDRAPTPHARREAPPPSAAPSFPRVAAAVVAVVVMVVAVGWGLDQRQAYQASRLELARAEATLAMLADDQDRIARWLNRTSVETRSFGADGGTARGTTLFLPDGRGLVVMRDEPQPGRDYQAWGVRDDAVTSLGVFAGRTIEVDAGPYQAVAVSLEPDGGSPEPTTVLGAVPKP